MSCRILKIDIEFVKKYFKEQGCQLLEENYINAHVKMKYICICGKESSINWNNFTNGKRCGCKRKEIQKFKECDIKKEVESKGYEFISCKYNGKAHLIVCKCKCGNQRACMLKNFRNSPRCRICLHRDLALDFNFVKKYFEKNGCELLEKEYENARKKLKYKCSCGRVSKICFYGFKNGNRCRKCCGEKMSIWLSKNRKGSNNPRWIEDRQQKKINDLFSNRCRGVLRRTLKRFNKNKESKTEKILGYKMSDLKLHIENHANWPKVKDDNWHIDHVFPLKAFIDYDILDVGLANSLENLQPMLGNENISKSAKYDSKYFENWLKSKNINIEKEEHTP